MDKQKRSKQEYFILIFYFALYLIVGLSLLFKQPYGNPPDEYNRYLIPRYIAEHGTLPNGYDESIRITGYGFSYGFQPILPYMIQGYTMRLVKCFSGDPTLMLYSARLVDFVFGLIMAVFVLLLGRKWFSDKRMQYIFSFLVMFLPQSIFLHTYVNTDSCCMLSIAVMLYGLTCCLENHFAYPSCITLSVGIIFCALSYYNAYGFILSSILLFFANYLSLQKGKLHLDLKPFLKKGFFISALVLLGIGWWFIRSYILYDGDFLGLHARDHCAMLYALPTLKPGFRITYQSQGYPLSYMLFSSDFLILTVNSFICTFGPMELTTALGVYRFFKYLFLIGGLCFLIPAGAKLFRESACPVASDLFPGRRVLRQFFHCNMLFCILMPFLLCLYYSYHTDYQPQGRYLLPGLIPLIYFVVKGLEKGVRAVCVLVCHLRKKTVNARLLGRTLTGVTVSILTLIIVCLLVTVYGYAFPYFENDPAQMMIQTMPPLESFTIFCMVS